MTGSSVNVSSSAAVLRKLADGAVGKGADLIANAARYVSTAAALRAMSAELVANVVIVGGTDGGLFRRDAADVASAEDGGAACGTIIRPADFATRGVFKRVDSGPIDLRWYGAVSGEDCSTAFTNFYAALALFSADGGIPVGTWIDKTKRTTNGSFRVVNLGPREKCIIRIDPTVEGAFWFDWFKPTATIHNSAVGFDGITFSLPAGSALTSGAVRFVDTLRGGTPRCQFLSGADVALEAVRFENDTLFCESCDMDGFYQDRFKIGCRLLPASEAAADRYTPVTTGTDSFDQFHSRGAEGHPRGTDSCLFLLNGELQRVLLDHCGGWPNGDNSSIFRVRVTDMKSAHFVNPWIDAADKTSAGPMGIFYFESPTRGGRIENPALGGLQFDAGETGQYWLPSRYASEILSSGNRGFPADTTTNGTKYVNSNRGIPTETNCKYFSFEDEFLGINSGVWTTTGTVIKSAALAHCAEIKPVAGTPAGMICGPVSLNEVRDDNTLAAEIRFRVSSLASMVFYLGLPRDGAAPQSSLSRDAWWFSNDDGSGAATDHLYVRTTDSTPAVVSTIDLGAIAADTFYVVRLVQARASATVYVFFNDNYLGTISRREFPKYLNLSAKDPGGSGASLFVDFVRCGGLRSIA